MKIRLQVILLGIGKAALCLLPLLCLPVQSGAQIPGAGSQTSQPALILALALTILVLFCIYLFQRHKTEKTKTEEVLPWTTGDNPLHTRLYETHKALNTLLAHPNIPMAKTSLEQGKILDATPILYHTLGYSKREFLKQRPETAGLLPTGEEEIRRLIDTGWTETLGELCHRTSGTRFKCRILSIATHHDGYPAVLSILPDLAVSSPRDPATDPAQHVDDLTLNPAAQRLKETR